MNYWQNNTVRSIKNETVFGSYGSDHLRSWKQTPLFSPLVLICEVATLILENPYFIGLHKDNVFYGTNSLSQGLTPSWANSWSVASNG